MNVWQEVLPVNVLYLCDVGSDQGMYFLCLNTCDFVFSALSDSMVVQNASFAVYFVCLLLFSSIANLIQFSIHCRNRGPKSLIVTCINLKKNSVTYIIYQVYTISIVTS